MINGGFDVDTNWNKQTSNWTISNGYAVCDGLQATNSSLFQDLAVVNGNSYRIDFTITDSANDLNLILGSTTIGQYGDGTHTIYVEKDNGGARIFFQATVSNAFQGSIDNVSVKEIIDATNIPRIDYTDGTASILLEPQSTNLFTYSSDYTQWNKSGSMAVASNNAISPNGTQDASLLTANAANQFIYLSAFAAANSTISLYIKRKTGTGVIDLSNDGGSNYTALSVTDEWNRVQVTFAAGTNQTVIKINTSGDEIYLWGVQLEALTYATSYIPTSGAIATRLADSITGAGDATTFNSTEGVLYVETSALADNDNGYIGLFGGSNSRVRIVFSNQIKAQLFNGSYQCNIGFTQSQTNNNKIAFKYKGDDFALWINGVEVGTDTIGLTFSANTLSYLNLGGYNGANNFFGKVKSLITFDTALTDAELECLTTI